METQETSRSYLLSSVKSALRILRSFTDHELETFETAKKTIQGIETLHMIKKG